MVKVKGVIENLWGDMPEIVKRDDEVNPMYGIRAVEITEEHISALRDGKCVYFNDGEYATILYMGNGEG